VPSAHGAGIRASLQGGLMPDVDAPIELHISDVTTEDLVDAFLVRDRHLQTLLRRWGLRLGILAAMLTLAYLAQRIVGSPGLGLINAGIYLYVGALSLVLCRPKRLYRMTSRRLVRDNPDLFGQRPSRSLMPAYSGGLQQVGRMLAGSTTSSTRSLTRRLCCSSQTGPPLPSSCSRSERSPPWATLSACAHSSTGTHGA
jgi:hypothetical protein